MIDGDFAILGDELQPVLKAMRAKGIHIVAIHQHMTHEEPRYFFFIIGAKVKHWIWRKLSDTRLM